MPCIKCGKKWKLGQNGPCIYRSKEACQKAYRAYLAKKKQQKLGPASHTAGQEYDTDELAEKNLESVMEQEPAAGD